ncbi:YraN family protein [Oceanithermus sp.]|jgi:putative endonuclease
MKGRWAEDAALEYLLARGYRLVARNRRTPYGEIDLWLEREGRPVFAEVKQRASGRYGTPLESIRPWKLERMKKSALYLLGREDVSVRFLAVLVLGTPGRYEISLQEIF